MPAKQFLILTKVQKNVAKLPRSIQKRLPHIFLQIQQDPIFGTRLHGELYGYYKVRLGEYRIVYEFAAKTSTVVVVKIEHRQGVYK